MTNENCIFCKIIKGEIPATKIFEDAETIAFLDINPVVSGHVLLIPKAHIEWIQDIPDELLGNMFIKSKDLIKAMKSGLPCDYVQVSVVGKDVPHFHIHLIPRMFHDNLHGWPTQKYPENEMNLIVEKIKKHL